MHGRAGVIWLKWARANGCEWGADTCLFAVKGGQLEVLKWARANGCDWDPAVCLQSAGDETMMKWIRIIKIFF